jgi:hypothetical protein
MIHGVGFTGPLLTMAQPPLLPESLFGWLVVVGAALSQTPRPLQLSPFPHGVAALQTAAQ